MDRSPPTSEGGSPVLVRVHRDRLGGVQALDRRWRDARPGMTLAALRGLGIHLGELRHLIAREIVQMSGPLPPSTRQRGDEDEERAQLAAWRDRRRWHHE